MALADLAILAVLGISLIFGVLRGVVREVLSLAAWVAALWAAFVYAALGGRYLESYIAHPPLQALAAFVSIFVLVLIVASVVGRLVRHLMPFSGVRGAGGLDRLLGMFFGFARGVIIIALFVTAAEFLEWSDQKWWDASLLIKYFHPTADFLRALTPEDLAAYFQPVTEIEDAF